MNYDNFHDNHSNLVSFKAFARITNVQYIQKISLSKKTRLRSITCLSFIAIFILLFFFNTAFTNTVFGEQKSIKVTICRVNELWYPDNDLIFATPGDYFANVKIGNQPFVKTPTIDTPQIFDTPYSITPNWVVRQTIDYTSGTVPIKLQIGDEDFGPDDGIDIDPNTGDITIDLEFDPNKPWIWQGDVKNGWNSVSGPTGGYHDRDGSASIRFDIQLSNNDQPSKNCGIDTDKDMIPDKIELEGILDDNGNMVADLPNMGADPCRENIAVELDYMSGASDGHTHKPTGRIIDDAVNMFDNAPYHPAIADDCPYSGFPKEKEGIGLLLDVNNKIPEMAILDFVNDDSDGNPANDFDTLKRMYFDSDRARYFHYGIWGHSSADNRNGAGEILGNDFIITPSYLNDHLVLESLFVHELGHNLGLAHGGADGTNCKPNYLSSMNYLFPSGIIFIPPNGIPTRIVDYSFRELPTLDEEHLNEFNGIGSYGIGNALARTFWSDPSMTLQNGMSNYPINWDKSSLNDVPTLQNDVAVNINNFILNNDPSNKDCQSPADEILTGFNDWQNIKLQFIGSDGFADIQPTGNGNASSTEYGTIPEELTIEETEFIKNFTDNVYRELLINTCSRDNATVISEFPVKINSSNINSTETTKKTNENNSVSICVA
ncbi:MAG: hypothetical protein AB7U98_01200 [Candidatus Nitrosocosmicus sp.]